MSSSFFGAISICAIYCTLSGAAADAANQTSDRPRTKLTEYDAEHYPALVKYYAPQQQHIRSDVDNAAMDALGSLYKKFKSSEDSKDADNLLLHIDRYAGQADMGRKNDKPDPYHYHQYGNGYYNNVRDQDETGRFEDGYVQVRTVDESTANHFDYLLYNAGIGVVDWLTKIPTAVEAYATAGHIFRLPSFYEFNPHEVVRPGDVDIYYSPYPSGGAGKHYYFRGNELLFATTDGGSLVEAGPNFWNDVHALDYGLSIQNGADEVGKLILSQVLKTWLPSNKFWLPDK